MKDWPGGMSFVLEGVTPPSAPGEVGLQLLAIGYKYNSQGRFSPLSVPRMPAQLQMVLHTNKRSGPMSTDMYELGG
jgi:hypothetical protein